jgi:hypothetical protein
MIIFELPGWIWLGSIAKDAGLCHRPVKKNFYGGLYLLQEGSIVIDAILGRHILLPASAFLKADNFIMCSHEPSLRQGQQRIPEITEPHSRDRLHRVQPATDGEDWLDEGE